MAEQGWSFAAGDGVVPDPIGGAHYLHGFDASIENAA
jgi:putative glutathione S-transferase